METPNNRIFLSIAIPTWNRANCLKKLLDSVLIQTRELEEKVEICVSDNDSSDDTQEIVTSFKEKYPDLINYNKNEKNFGGQINILKVMEISRGEFIWLFGDDDLVVPDGLKNVINFIKENCKENTALFTLREEAYFLDEKSGKKTIYHSSFEPDKPLVYEISRENIIRENFPCCTFISALIFKSSLLKTVLNQEGALIEKARDLEYIHTFLYRLMFIKFPDVKAITLNKIIIFQEMALYKVYIEGNFKSHYVFPRKSNNLLILSGYMTNALKDILIKESKKFRTNVIQDIIMMKTFCSFNYSSFVGVLKLFFKEAGFKDALTFSFVFFVMFLTPSFVLKIFLKIYFFIKYNKDCKRHWIFCEAVHFRASQGQRPVQ